MIKELAVLAYGVGISILFILITPVLFVIDFIFTPNTFEDLKAIYIKSFKSIWEDVAQWRERNSRY